MFNFGNPEDLARMHLDAVTGGPGLPDMPLDEMTEDDLRELIIYLRAAVDAAHVEAPEETVKVLEEWYFRAFREFCRVNREYCRRVLNGQWRPPFGKIDNFRNVVRLIMSGDLQEFD